MAEQRIHLGRGIVAVVDKRVVNVKQNAFVAQRGQLFIVDGKYAVNMGRGYQRSSMRGLHIVADGVDLVGDIPAKSVRKKALPMVKYAAPAALISSNPGKAVHTARQADRRMDRRDERTVQRRRVAGIAVAQQINAVHALG